MLDQLTERHQVIVYREFINRLKLDRELRSIMRRDLRQKRMLAVLDFLITVEVSKLPGQFALRLIGSWTRFRSSLTFATRMEVISPFTSIVNLLYYPTEVFIVIKILTLWDKSEKWQKTGIRLGRTYHLLMIVLEFGKTNTSIYQLVIHFATIRMFYWGRKKED